MSSTIWSGVIGFGMVSIPVKLYSATDTKRISFNQLHSKCNSRIKEIRWCPTCDREVPWDEVIKGYAVTKDDYIAVTDEDFEKLPLPSKNIINISSFAQAEEVDPLYFEKNYYLLPDKQGERAFNLFLKALETKSLLAIGKIAIRSRERLCALRAVGGTLVLCTLLYQDEVRVDLAAEPPATKLPKQELDMALSLIDLMSQPFDPAAYKDDYKEALNELIENKLQGTGAKKTKAAQPRAVVDLMDALRASLNTAGANRGSTSGTKRTVRVAKTTNDKNKVATKSSATRRSK